MKGELNLPGKVALRKESLDHGSYSLEEGFRERVLDTYVPGVLAGSQVNGETGPFWISAGATALTINVGTGSAIAPSGIVPFESLVAADPQYGCIGLETGGERVVVPLLDVGATASNWTRIESSAGSGAGSGPFQETDDGLGGWAFTPQSTGALAVGLLTDNATNRIWMSYVPRIDTSFYSIHPLTGAKIYSRKLDGYEIHFTTSDVKPYTDERYFKIGEVVTSSGAVMAISQSMMPFAKSKTNRVGIAVDSSKAPTAYANGTTGIFLDDHVNAIGSGTVTPANPHGMSVGDVGGYTGIGVSHNQMAHTDGIKGIDSTVLEMSVQTVIGLGQRILRVKQLQAGEYVTIGGIPNTLVTPQIVIGGDDAAYVQFDGTVPDDTYNIYLSMNGSQCVVDRMVHSAGSVIIGQVTWVGGGSPVLTIDVDYRAQAFGMLGADNIIAGAISSYKVHISDAGTGQDVTTGNGIKTAHLKDSSVTTPKLADGAVTADKITALAITGGTGGNIGYGAVQTNNIANNAVTQDKVATNITFPTPIRWCVQGEVNPATKIVQTMADKASSIVRVDIYEDSIAPAPYDLWVDVLINGVSIFSVGAYGVPAILGGTTPNFSPGVYVTCDNNTALGIGSPVPNPAKGQRVGLIDVSKNMIAVGDRISLNLPVAPSAGMGGGNDLLVTLVMG